MKHVPSLDDFEEAFPTEESCWTHLRDARWGEDSFTCPDCGESEHWGFIETRDLFECYQCHKQTSVTAGTILQDTKLDLRTWFRAVHLLTTTKKSVSGLELARKLGVHPETGYHVHQKVCHVLGTTEGRALFGIVEGDETYVGGKRPEDDSGRGTSKAQVLGLVEHREDHAGNLHLMHVPDGSGETLGGVVRDRVAGDACVWTDGWAGYQGLDGGRDGGQDGREHEARVPGPDEQAHDVLPWFHTVASNLKDVVHHVHRFVSDANVQPYLDAFRYRFNHRARLGDGFRKALEKLPLVGPQPNTELARERGVPVGVSS
jgi:predicted RNA-binding Zn-ribbon protein involved in translation (DUF1610 family)/transposase-like protein